MTMDKMKDNIKKQYKKPTIHMDFDGTFRDSLELREFAKELVDKGYDVQITTRRSDNPDKTSDEYIEAFPAWEVHDMASRAGVTKVNFTHGEYKYKFFEGKENVIFIDDDPLELSLITMGYLSGKNGVIGYHISLIDKFKQYIRNHESTATT